MGAFILAACVFVVTICISILIVLADGMSDAPSVDNQISPFPVLVGGVIISALLFASHWLHIGW